MKKSLQAIAYHFFLSFLLFLPYFVFGKFPLWSTDNLYVNIPNLMFVRQNLAQGEIPLWNPYILGGLDYTASSLNEMFSPLDWILFIFPASKLLSLLALRNFIELALIGISAFFFFKKEFQSDRWAIFCSTIMQIGGLSLWALTNFHMPVILFVLISLNIIWSFESRRSIRSFVLLTASLTALLLSSSVPYAIAGLITVIIFYGYRFWPHFLGLNIKKGFQHVFIGSFITAVLLTMFRILPFAETFASGNRTHYLENPALLMTASSEKDTEYFLLDLFAPELFGVSYHTAQDVAKKIYPQNSGFKHTHNVDISYIGIVPILLCIWALVNLRSRQCLFFLLLSLFSGAAVLKIKPLSDIILMIFSPIFHGCIVRILLFFSLCTLTGHAAIALERQQKVSIQEFLKALIVVLLSFLCCFLLLAHQSAAFFLSAKVAVTFTIISLMISLASFGSRQNLNRELMILGLSVFIMCLPILSLFESVRESLTSNDLNYLIFISTVGYLLIMYLIFKGFNRLKKGISFRNIFLAICFTFFLLLIFWNIPRDYPLIEGPGYDFFAIMGLIKYLVTVIIFFVVVMATLQKTEWRRYFFPVLFCLMIVDLMCYQNVYRHWVTMPFIEESYLSTFKMKPPINFKGEISQREDFEQTPIGDLSYDVENPSHGNLTFRISPVDPLGGMALRVRKKDDNISVISKKMPADYFKGSGLYFGAYVKANHKNRLRLALMKGDQIQYSKYYQGNNEWEWLFLKQPLSNAEPEIKAMFTIEGKGTYYLDDIILTDQFFNADEIDLKNYRVNLPHAFLKIQNVEHGDNILENAGIRMYGGVNALLQRNFLTFFGNFHSDFKAEDYYSGFFRSIGKDERFLQLMGCKYDVAPDFSIVTHENALSRFMLFKDFEIISDDEKILKRLKDPSFNPGQTLIINQPETFQAEPSPAEIVHPVKLSNNHIELMTESDASTLLFFNDVYNPNWKVKINGQSVEVLRANYLFMCVRVPKGENKITLDFHPKRFFLGLKIAMITFIILMIMIFCEFAMFRRMTSI
jgi:hypothetical protein